jgi:hypothetical protein
MSFGDHTVKEPSEYAEELERVLHIEDPLAQHNAVVELLQRCRSDRELTDLPDYDPLLRKMDQLERHAAQRLAQASSEPPGAS